MVSNCIEILNNDFEKMKSCCFIGHRNLYDKREIFSLMIQKIERLILDGFSIFFFGGYGDFDDICFSAVRELKGKYSYIKTIYYQAYYKPHDTNMGFLKAKYDCIIYPEIEEKPKRFAIVYRNREIIDHSDFCIFFCSFSYGGAYQALQYAKHKKKALINIGSYH